MSLAIIFHFLCAQHVSNINISIIRSLRSRKLLMMDILMSETCWAHKKWNIISSDIKLVFYSSTVTVMHSPINISIILVCSNMHHKAHIWYLLTSASRHQSALQSPFLNWLINMNWYVSGILQCTRQISQQICSTEFSLLEMNNAIFPLLCCTHPYCTITFF